MEYFIKRTPTLIFVFTTLFLLLTVFLPSKGYNDELLMISSVAAFIFGLVIVFAITNKNDRLNKVNELLKLENSYNLRIFKLSKMLDKDMHENVAKHLDSYIQDTIDYPLEDFSQSNKSFDKLYSYVMGTMHVKGIKEDILYEEMVRTLNESLSNRIQISTLTSDRLSKYEWISISGLTTVIIFILYRMSDPNILSSLELTILAGSSFLLVLILRDINNLKWQKQEWTWDPLFDLFVSMGMIPYFPKGVVKTGEYKIPHGATVRVGHHVIDDSGKPKRVIEMINNP